MRPARHGSGWPVDTLLQRIATSGAYQIDKQRHQGHHQQGASGASEVVFLNKKKCVHCDGGNRAGTALGGIVWMQTLI